MFVKDFEMPLLPSKTLALSFDDGPGTTDAPLPATGPRTLELAQFLHKEGIEATFFVIGCYAEAHLDILRQVADLGHLIANHTYNHPGTEEWERIRDPVNHVSEIKRTHQIIAPYVRGRFLFRAPGGASWPNANVVEQLNSDPELAQYVGAVGWHVDEADYDFWREARSPVSCMERYLAAIQQKASRGEGIVLMHDSSCPQEPVTRAANRCLELARLLIPKLKALNFTFARLDRVLP